MIENCEQLCLSLFYMKKYCYKSSNFYDARIGKKISSFCFVSEGSVTIETATNKIYADSGDLLYMPCGIRYCSNWLGNPEIEFYGIDFQFKKDNNVRFDHQFDLQKIESRSVAKFREAVESMYKNYKSNNEDQLLAISEFYGLFHQVMPCLTKINSMEIPLSLQKALSFIEQHYAEDYNTKDLADYCYLSESRLYNLFQDKMGCTPITFKNNIKIQYAIELLRETNSSVEEISDKLNFHSTVYFRKVFRKITGFNPFEYRRLVNKKL